LQNCQCNIEYVHNEAGIRWCSVCNDIFSIGYRYRTIGACIVESIEKEFIANEQGPLVVRAKVLYENEPRATGEKIFKRKDLDFRQ
jgi:hypothetical protein